MLLMQQGLWVHQHPCILDATVLSLLHMPADREKAAARVPGSD